MNPTPQQEPLADQLECLSALDAGVVYGKEDAWDQLEQRLPGGAKRKRIRIWPGIAALAALLVVLYWVLPSGERKGSTDVTQSTAMPAKAKDTATLNIEKNMVVQVAESVAVKQLPSNVKQAPVRIQDHVEPVTISGMDTTMETPTTQLQHPPIVDTDNVGTAENRGKPTTVPIAARLAKLPVVHISDLPEYQSNSDNSAANRNHISVRFLGGFRSREGDGQAGLMTISIRRK